MLIKDVGDTAFSIELDDNAQVVGLRAAIRRSAPLAGLIEVVPSRQSLLVSFDPLATSRTEMQARITALVTEIGEGVSVEGRLWRIPVRYDGPDLEEVAKACGLSSHDVVALHGGATYEVIMLGFMPGFAYLGGLPEPL